jgi:hypothetical protein
MQWSFTCINLVSNAKRAADRIDTRYGAGSGGAYAGAAMPMFFFHLLNGDGYLPDEEGKELADLDAARRHGLKALGQVAADEMAGGADNLRATIFIDDSREERLMTLPLTLSVGK